MSAHQHLSAQDDPASAKEKAVEKIVRNADLKKFDPELEEALHRDSGQPPEPT